MSSISRGRARGFGSRAEKSNASTRIGSETTIAIGKMSAEKIEIMNGAGVLRSWQGPPDQTFTETETTATGKIGNAPIDGVPTVIDPIGSGNPALLGRRHHAIETATIERGEIGNAPTARIPIVTAGTPPGRQSHAIEIATIGIEKTGSVLTTGTPIAGVQIASGSPARRHRKYRAVGTVTIGIEKTGSVLMAGLQIVSGQIESDAPTLRGQKHGKIIKVSGANGERAGAIAMTAQELPSGRPGKVQPPSTGRRCADQTIPGTTDAGRTGNRSDPIVRTTKSLAPSGPPIESAPVQNQDAQSQGQVVIRGRKPESIVAPRGWTELSRKARAGSSQGETMTRGKSGEGLRGAHRERMWRTIVDRESLNSLRASSDLEASLEETRHPIRDRIGSRLPVRLGRAGAEATMAIRRETGTKRSAVDNTTVVVTSSLLLDRRSPLSPVPRLSLQKSATPKNPATIQGTRERTRRQLRHFK